MKEALRTLLQAQPQLLQSNGAFMVHPHPDVLTCDFESLKNAWRKALKHFHHKTMDSKA